MPIQRLYPQQSTVSLRFLGSWFCNWHSATQIPSHNRELSNVKLDTTQMGMSSGKLEVETRLQAEQKFMMDSHSCINLNHNNYNIFSYGRYRSSQWLYDNPQRFEDHNILNVPNANI